MFEAYATLWYLPTLRDLEVKSILPQMNSFMLSFVIFTKSASSSLQASLAFSHFFSSSYSLMHVPECVLGVHSEGQETLGKISKKKSICKQKDE